ncbi:hypothetical protein [Polyangium sp. 15x6]|uniref:hypothetical protein n=1 Tax=Polyangium sp. 15x6 TaxID=3042687 RepID=UPI00249ABDA2|nr:hypothetical protein [Polyangium sp. 15x6]MDI3285867.1 hypothetical protein [Polyangium sp. 15x6]
MSEGKKSPSEKVSTEEAIEFEIAELDDLDLAGVSGGARKEDKGDITNGFACPTNNCGSKRG